MWPCHVPVLPVLALVKIIVHLCQPMFPAEHRSPSCLSMRIICISCCLTKPLPMTRVHPGPGRVTLALCNFIFTALPQSCLLADFECYKSWRALLCSFPSSQLSVTQQLLPRQSKGLSMKMWKRQCCPVTELPFCLFLTHPPCSHSLHSSPLAPLSFDLN